MSNQLGYYYPQQAVAVPSAPAQPPSFEGTALSATIGAGVGALATQGLMFLANVQPKTLLANGMITAGVAAFGGATGALSYRMSARRAYNAAQHAMRVTGSGQDSVNSFRINGRLGKLGQVDIEVPVQGIVDATRAYQRMLSPNTPDVVEKYYEAAAQHATQVAAQGFTQFMPPPQAWSAMPGQFQQQCAPNMYPPPPFQYYQQQYPQPQYPPYPPFYGVPQPQPQQQQQAPKNGK